MVPGRLLLIIVVGLSLWAFLYAMFVILN